MARSDLLLDLVRSGAEGDNELFRKTLEALIAEERGKQHHALADRLASSLPKSESPTRRLVAASVTSADRSGYSEVRAQRSLADLVLPTQVASSARDLIEEHMRADLLRAHNLEPRNRVLLSGPPGNGKTTLAEAVAFELALPLFTVRYENVIGSYLGETSLRLAQLFSQVRSHRCVLFFDEFDVVGKERADAHETGEIKRLVSTLLLQVDQLPSHVIVIAATNHTELLDRAVWRRFQLRLRLPTPTNRERIAWLRAFESRWGARFEVPLDRIAREIGTVSYAELEEFALDVQRRYVLSLPEANVRSIVLRRLGEWSARATPKSNDAR